MSAYGVMQSTRRPDEKASRSYERLDRIKRRTSALANDCMRNVDNSVVAVLFDLG